MKKKILVLTLAVVLFCFSMTACAGGRSLADMWGDLWGKDTDTSYNPFPHEPTPKPGEDDPDVAAKQFYEVSTESSSLTSFTWDLHTEPLKSFSSRVDVPLNVNLANADKAGVHLYDPSERIGNVENLDALEDEDDEHKVLLADVMALVNKEISWHELLQKKPKRIHMISNIKTAFDLLRQEYRFDNTFRQLEVTYIYGQTAKGKTRYVMERFGYKNVYRVTKYDHTAFDRYNGQDCVIFEEYRSSFKIEDMLNYLDGYPLMLPSRYNDKEAAYTKVYITTNWALNEQYKNIQTSHPSTWQAFLRRIQTVYDFDKSKDIPITKTTGALNVKQGKLILVENVDELPF